MPSMRAESVYSMCGGSLTGSRIPVTRCFEMAPSAWIFYAALSAPLARAFEA